MKVECDYKPGSISAEDMKIGDVALIMENGDYLLRHYAGWVSLNNPRSTWSVDCTLRVIPVPPNTRIVLFTE